MKKIQQSPNYNIMGSVIWVFTQGDLIWGGQKKKNKHMYMYVSVSYLFTYST